MNRFFYRQAQREGRTVSLDGEDAHHAARVLRVKAGDFLELCDENGACHRAHIDKVAADRVLCTLLEPLPCTEARTWVDLAFGLLKGEKTDFVLQKATELGVQNFLPFESERTVVKLAGKEDARLDRWQKIVRAAAAQAHRAVVPGISPPQKFGKLLSGFPAYDLVVLFWEAEKAAGLSAVMPPRAEPSRILVVTGPEGGFSAHEVEAAKAAGAKVATLGPRVLRAETAAIVAAALCLYQAGDLGG